MKTIRNDKVIMYDVDETLIHWYNPGDDEKAPIAIGEEVFWVNIYEVERLKKSHEIGYTIIVWSQSGWEWVERVCEALEITKYVTIGMTKPLFFIDDIPLKFWTKRLKPKENREWEL